MYVEKKKDERKESYFYNMRLFHNSIKSNLIRKNLYNKSVLDLACGKGGDLGKWYKSNVQSVVGYDINNESIIEANRRKSKFKNFNVNLSTLDLSKNVVKLKDTVDVVSSMFAFHYFLENEEIFKIIMQSIKNNLKVDGLFIGTFFDGKLVQQYIDSNEKNNLDKECKFFKINKKGENNNTLFGNKIGVLIKETVLDIETDEYIVDFDMFVQKMKEYDLKLIYTNVFGNLYDSYNGKENLSNIEKKLSFLNRCFIFKNC